MRELWGTVPLEEYMYLYEDYNNELIVQIDNELYRIVLPTREYKTSLNHFYSEFIDEIDAIIENGNYPFHCVLGGKHWSDGHYNVLVLKLNDDVSDNVKFEGVFGNGADDLFGYKQFDKNLTPNFIVGNWSNIGGTDWIVEDDAVKLNINDHSNDRIIYNPYELNSTNYTLSVKFRAEEDDDVFGLVFGLVDEENYYFLGYEGGGLGWGEENLRLYKVTDGIEEVLSSTTRFPAWQTSTEYELKVSFNSEEIRFYLNGELANVHPLEDEEVVGSYGLIGKSQIFYASDMRVEYS